MSNQDFITYFYNLNFGIYFDHLKNLEWAKIYTSDLIQEEYNNHALISNLNGDYKNKLDIVEKYLISKNRLPAIYITPETYPLNKKTLIKKLGYSNSFEDAWMV